jgi:MFS family permease
MLQVFKVKQASFAMAANAIAMYNVSFFNSFFSVELTNEFGVKDEDMGYYFSILSFSYLSSAILIPIFFKKVPRKAQFVICFCLTSVSMAFMGPSKLLGFPKSLTFILIGLPMLGFFQALCFIPSLPEAIEVYQNEFKIVEGVSPALDNKLNDVVSSAYGLFYNLSSLVGPILGGAMFDIFGYRTTLDINMFLELIAVGIFFYYNCGLDVVKKNEIFLEDMAKLKEVSDKYKELKKKEAKE